MEQQQDSLIRTPFVLPPRISAAHLWFLRTRLCHLQLSRKWWMTCAAGWKPRYWLFAYRNSTSLSSFSRSFKLPPAQLVLSSPLTSCSAQLRWDADRQSSSPACLPQRLASFLPISHCSRASRGLWDTPGLPLAYQRLQWQRHFPVHRRNIIYSPVTAKALLWSKHN